MDSHIYLQRRESIDCDHNKFYFEILVDTISVGVHSAGKKTIRPISIISLQRNYEIRQYQRTRQILKRFENQPSFCRKPAKVSILYKNGSIAVYWIRVSNIPQGSLRPNRLNNVPLNLVIRILYKEPETESPWWLKGRANILYQRLKYDK